MSTTSKACHSERLQAVGRDRHFVAPALEQALRETLVHDVVLGEQDVQPAFGQLGGQHRRGHLDARALVA
jgi:hypothetical protein